MTEFNNAFSNGLNIENCNNEELDDIAEQFSEMKYTIADSLYAIGSLMMWLPTANSECNDCIPQDEVIDVFSKLGGALRLLSCIQILSTTGQQKADSFLNMNLSNRTTTQKENNSVIKE